MNADFRDGAVVITDPDVVSIEYKSYCVNTDIVHDLKHPVSIGTVVC